MLGGGTKPKPPNNFITNIKQCRLTGFINQQTKDQYLHTFINR